MRLIVTLELRLSLYDVDPVSKPFAPPLIVFGDRMKLGKVECHRFDQDLATPCLALLRQGLCPHTFLVDFVSSLPNLFRRIVLATRFLPHLPIAREVPSDLKAQPRLQANSDASSRTRISMPSRAGIPSQPIDVLTAGTPCDIASRSLTRIPLPIRRGTSITLPLTASPNRGHIP